MGWIGTAVYLVAPKRTPSILIFSIAMGADYSFEVKNIEIWVPAFFKHNNSFVATMQRELKLICQWTRIWTIQNLDETHLGRYASHMERKMRLPLQMECPSNSRKIRLLPTIWLSHYLVHRSTYHVQSIVWCRWWGYTCGVNRILSPLLATIS